MRRAIADIRLLPLGGELLGAAAVDRLRGGAEEREQVVERAGLVELRRGRAGDRGLCERDLGEVGDESLEEVGGEAVLGLVVAEEEAAAGLDEGVHQTCELV